MKLNGGAWRRTYRAGSNMHCKVGLAIWEKAALIWACFDAGTQSFSMEIGIFHRGNGVIIQTNTNRFGMRPAADHMRGA
jgi:hypothetical protein